jgi:hypothetical protein
MIKNQESTATNEENKSQYKPIYQKPKTSLFLEKATDIQSGGAIHVAESQGNGYLTS